LSKKNGIDILFVCVCVSRACDVFERNRRRIKKEK
jgi:predicted secreted protein